MVCHAFPMNLKLESKAQGRDEMIPWCWNSPFVPLTNRFSASDVSSEERVEKKKKSGRENLPDNIKCSCSAWAHAEKLAVWKRFLPKSDVCFWTLMRSVTIAQIEKCGQNTLAFFPPPFKLLKHFHRIRGKKTSGSVTMSSVREFVSDFQHFSHTCALWVMLKRSCVQDVDGLLISNSFHSLTMWHIWYVNWRLDSLKPSSLHHTSSSILA